MSRVFCENYDANLSVDLWQFRGHFLKRCQSRFASSQTELSVLKEGVKGLFCVHCNASGTLNSHGYLTDQSGAIRGLRLWCCPRRASHPGCGKTFSIWLAGVLPGFSVPSVVVACFLLAWTQLGGNVLAAWEQAKTGFSTDSAYRWIRRFKYNQGEVRTQLCRARAPPPPREGGILADLFEHLSLVLGSEDFIKTFQLRFQRPWPMGV